MHDHLNTINSLCTVLGINYKETVYRIHPTLDDLHGAKDASNNTIARLAAQIQSLQGLKIKRMEKVTSINIGYFSFLCFMFEPLEKIYFCLVSLILWVLLLPDSRSCICFVGALAFDGYTGRGTTTISERYL